MKASIGNNNSILHALTMIIPAYLSCSSAVRLLLKATGAIRLKLLLSALLASSHMRLVEAHFGTRLYIRRTWRLSARDGTFGNDESSSLKPVERDH